MIESYHKAATVADRVREALVELERVVRLGSIPGCDPCDTALAQAAAALATSPAPEQLPRQGQAAPVADGAKSAGQVAFEAFARANPTLPFDFASLMPEKRAQWESAADSNGIGLRSPAPEQPPLVDAVLEVSLEKPLTLQRALTVALDDNERQRARAEKAESSLAQVTRDARELAGLWKKRAEQAGVLSPLDYDKGNATCVRLLSAQPAEPAKEPNVTTSLATHAEKLPGPDAGMEAVRREGVRRGEVPLEGAALVSRPRASVQEVAQPAEPAGDSGEQLSPVAQWLEALTHRVLVSTENVKARDEWTAKLITSALSGSPVTVEEGPLREALELVAKLRADFDEACDRWGATRQQCDAFNAELRAREAERSKLADTWARYQRRDLDREEFEGTVAEYCERPSKPAKVEQASEVTGQAAINLLRSLQLYDSRGAVEGAFADDVSKVCASLRGFEKAATRWHDNYRTTQARVAQLTSDRTLAEARAEKAESSLAQVTRDARELAELWFKARRWSASPSRGDELARKLSAQPAEPADSLVTKLWELQRRLAAEGGERNGTQEAWSIACDLQELLTSAGHPLPGGASDSPVQDSTSDMATPAVSAVAQPAEPAGDSGELPDEQRGLYRKYQVERLNDPSGKHSRCEYFVLDLDHDKYAGPALRAYADACEAEFPSLVRDLRTRWPAEPTPATASPEQEELPQCPECDTQAIRLDDADGKWEAHGEVAEWKIPTFICPACNFGFQPDTDADRLPIERAMGRIIRKTQARAEKAETSLAQVRRDARELLTTPHMNCAELRRELLELLSAQPAEPAGDSGEEYGLAVRTVEAVVARHITSALSGSPVTVEEGPLREALERVADLRSANTEVVANMREEEQAATEFMQQVDALTAELRDQHEVFTEALLAADRKHDALAVELRAREARVAELEELNRAGSVELADTRDERRALRLELEGDNGLRASNAAGWALAQARLKELEQKTAELRAREAERSKLADTWARYRRCDLGREEFEGTVAEYCERPSKPAKVEQPAPEAEGWCANCGHSETDHPRGEHCGAATESRCECSAYAASEQPAPEDSTASICGYQSSIAVEPCDRRKGHVGSHRLKLKPLPAPEDSGSTRGCDDGALPLSSDVDDCDRVAPSGGEVGALSGDGGGGSAGESSPLQVFSDIGAAVGPIDADATVAKIRDLEPITPEPPAEQVPQREESLSRSELVGALRDLASRWTVGATSPQDLLTALADKLWRQREESGR